MSLRFSKSKNRLDPVCPENFNPAGVTIRTKKAAGRASGGLDPIVRRRRKCCLAARCLALAQGVGALAQIVGFLDQRLLLGRILDEARFLSKQESPEDHRL